MSKTEIIAIGDRSGSMGPIRTDAIGGFNAFIADQKTVPGDATVTLVLFNDTVETVFENKPLNDVEPLTSKTYAPSGNTALYDAIGQTVSSAVWRHGRMDASERPDKVIAVVLTDGQENMSRNYTLPSINALITEQRNAGWEFVFLAANQDAFTGASQLGMDPNMSVSFEATGEGVRSGYLSTSKAVRSYRTA